MWAVPTLKYPQTKDELLQIPKGVRRKIFFAHYYLTRQRLRTVAIMGLGLIASLSEGIGIMSLVLVLKLILSPTEEIDDQSGLSQGCLTSTRLGQTE